MCDIEEWLKEEIAYKSGSGYRNGCPDCGIAANNLRACLDEIERLKAALRAVVNDGSAPTWVIEKSKQALEGDKT